MNRDVDAVAVTVGDMQFMGKQLNDSGKHLLRHILDLNEQAAELRFKLEQIETARLTYDAALKKLVQPDEERAA